MTPKDLPLPEPFEVFTEDEPNSIITGYTADQMREYGDARAEHARKQALEEAAVAAWNHYMDTCKKLRLPPAAQEYWMACDAIRSLK